MKEEKAHGRPRFEEEPQRQRNISLCDRLADIAKRIGGGTISKGIRKALEDYKEQ